MGGYEANDSADARQDAATEEGRVLCAGLDGCSAGWLGVGLTAEGEPRWSLWPDLAAAWVDLAGCRLVLVDIPIGLRREDGRARRCDAEARKLLGARASSVFPPPVRPTLEAESYEKACEINLEATGKKITLQAWHISPKIRQADRLLRGLPDRGVGWRNWGSAGSSGLRPEAVEKIRGSLRESHPEVVFQALAGG